MPGYDQIPFVFYRWLSTIERGYNPNHRLRRRYRNQLERFSRRLEIDREAAVRIPMEWYAMCTDPEYFAFGG